MQIRTILTNVTHMNMQEQWYTAEVDYRKGSPHLTHWHLHDQLVEIIRGVVQQLPGPARVLEIGAGHGGFTEPVLAMGCEVVAVDMSRSSVAELDRRFGMNSRLSTVHYSGGDLPISRQFDLVLCVSVLHHIPNYLAFLEAAVTRLRPGGALVTLQDPTWYARHRAAHRVNQATYLAWRVGQGDYRRGVATRLRRLQGRYDENNISDMVEYHVVRKGVDEAALLDFAVQRFRSARLTCYWSTQSRIWQRVGARLRLPSTFGVIANGYGEVRPPRKDPRY